MAKPVLAMEKSEIRGMLRRAGGEKLNCAVVLHKDTGDALVRFDLRKGPKVLLGQLNVEFPGGKTGAFGTAQMSPDTPGLLKLDLNRMPGGVTRKLLKAVKGSGIKRVDASGKDGPS